MPKMAAASQTGPRASQPGGLGWSYSEASGRHCLIAFLIIPRYSYQIISFPFHSLIFMYILGG